MQTVGRALLPIAAILLTATAGIHASGCPMIAGWIQDLPVQQSQGLQLVWLTDTLSWIVTAIIWCVAFFRMEQAWLRASLALASIPLITGAALVLIEPLFFGGYLLVLSGLLAVTGVALSTSNDRHAES